MISTEFPTDIRGSPMTHPTYFSNPPTSPIEPLCGWCLWFWLKYLENYWLPQTLAKIFMLPSGWVLILLSTIMGLKTLVCSDVPHWILDCNSFWVADCVAAEVSLIPSPAFLCPLSNLKIRVWVTWVSGSLLDWIYHTGGSMFPCNHY